MVFDLIVSLIAGGALIKDTCMRGQTTANNRFTAENSGKKWYYDGDHKMRATDTNEILSYQYHTGHGRLVGVRTGRVYEDKAQNKIDALNMRLKEKGKTKFIYKDYPQWREKSGSRVLIRFDVEKKRPYMICGESLIYYQSSIKQYVKPRMAYIDMKKSKYSPSIDFSTQRELTEEEFEMYTDKETGAYFTIKQGWS